LDQTSLTSRNHGENVLIANIVQPERRDQAADSCYFMGHRPEDGFPVSGKPGSNLQTSALPEFAGEAQRRDAVRRLRSRHRRRQASTCRFGRRSPCVPLNPESHGSAVPLLEQTGTSVTVFGIFKRRSVLDHAERVTLARPDSPVGNNQHTYEENADCWRAPAGAVLGRTSNEQFPQLLNVPNRHISQDAPGPLPVIDNARAWGEKQADRRRVRPGLTGMSQSGRRSSTTGAEATRLDPFVPGNRNLCVEPAALMRATAAARGAAHAEASHHSERRERLWIL
jgi:lipopolysaccharide/colanic/teichoic acid biosynthesis glycosyltransferase